MSLRTKRSLDTIDPNTFGNSPAAHILAEVLTGQGNQLAQESRMSGMTGTKLLRSIAHTLNPFYATMQQIDALPHPYRVTIRNLYVKDTMWAIESKEWSNVVKSLVYSVCVARSRQGVGDAESKI